MKLRCVGGKVGRGITGAVEPVRMTVPITSCNPPPRRCAECLGILGAVDPARVTVLMPLPEPLCEFRRDGTLAFEAQLVQRCGAGGGRGGG